MVVEEREEFTPRSSHGMGKRQLLLERGSRLQQLLVRSKEDEGTLRKIPSTFLQYSLLVSLNSHAKTSFC